MQKRTQYPKPDNHIDGRVLRKQLEGHGFTVKLSYKGRDGFAAMRLQDYVLNIGDRFHLWAGAQGEGPKRNKPTWNYALFYAAPAADHDYNEKSMIIEHADLKVVLAAFAKELKGLANVYTQYAAFLEEQ